MAEEEVIEQNPAENVLQAEPVVEPITETVEEVVEAEPSESVTEPETPEAEDKRKNPWFLKRISAEAEARRVAEAERDNFKALAERLQAGKTETPPAPPPAQDFQTAVQREAARMRLSEDSTSIRDAGFREFGQSFKQNLDILNAAGAVSDDMVLDLIAVDKDNAHKILATLAQDPDRATAIAAMDSRRRTAELTRISMAASTPTQAAAPKAPAKQVSRAPAPPPPVEPSATKTVPWWSDDASDADFDKGFYDPNRMKKRQRL